MPPSNDWGAIQSRMCHLRSISAAELLLNSMPDAVGANEYLAMHQLMSGESPLKRPLTSPGASPAAGRRRGAALVVAAALASIFVTSNFSTFATESARSGCVLRSMTMAYRMRDMKHRCLTAAAIFLSMIHAAPSQGRSIVVASTTSTEQSGLFGFLLPRFLVTTGIQVKVVAVGTGQALDIGRRGDADVVFVHDRPAEEKFIAEGGGVRRFDVMYNDFVVIGPMADPAHIAGGMDVIAAFRKIAAANAPFISRGDRSGTNEAELRYWKDAGIALNAARDRWYREIGQGMGPALNMAAASNAYLLSDRDTWLSFRNSGTLVILVEGDRALFNQYGVMLVSPAKHPNVKAADGQAFVDWLISAEGQNTIAQYKINGQQLFFPDAEPAQQP
jgi:tungstate transport system substrate-binding protein